MATRISRPQCGAQLGAENFAQDFEYLIVEALGATPPCWQTFVAADHMTPLEWYAVLEYLTAIICEEFESPYFSFSEIEVAEHAERPLCDLSLLIDLKLRTPEAVITQEWSMQPC